VAAEGLTHRRKELVLIVRFTTSCETMIQRGGEVWDRNTLIDRGLCHPTALVRIRDLTPELVEAGSFVRGAAVKSAPPQPGDITPFEIILIILRVVQRWAAVQPEIVYPYRRFQP
jgi:hypothetical protein